MFCPKCGKEIKSGSNFCPYCGERFTGIRGETMGPVHEKEEQKNESSPSPVGNVHKEPPQKKKGGVPLVAVIAAALAVVVIAAVAVFFFMRKTDGKAEASGAALEEAASVEETTGGIRVTESAEEAPTEEETLSETAESENFELQPEESLTEAVAEDVQANLVNGADVNLSGLFRAGFSDSWESSHIVQNTQNNTAQVAMDGDEVTSWQEGVEGSGIGEFIGYEFSPELDIKYISFKLGNWRNDKYYYGNNKPSSLRISINDESWTVDFPQEKMEYWVEFSEPVRGSVITFTIEDVYRGNGSYDDTCIADIGVWGKN